MTPKRFIILTALIICLLPSFVCFAQEVSFEDDPDRPIMLGIVYTADNIEFARQDNIIIGTGNVKITYKDMSLEGDKVIININEKKAFCKGKAFLKQGDKEFSGDNITYDFLLEKGFLSDARVDVPPWYFYSDEISKDADNKVEIDNTFISTCEQENPHWRINTKKLVIYLGDKIVAKNVVVYIGNIPVFYWHKYVHSLKDKRGKILFVPGRSGEYGTYLYTGYRYYIDENNKGAVRIDLRQKKGLAYGWDHEYSADECEGVFRIYYLDERDKSSHPITKDERHRVRWTHKQKFNDNLWGVFEWHKQSDADIIKDYIKREYEKNPEPESYIYLQDKFPNYNLSLYANKQTNSFHDKIEYHPQLRLYSNYYEIFDSPFYIKTDTTLSNINKEWTTAGESVNRFDTYQELTLSKKIGALRLRPYIGVRQTYYSRDVNQKEELRGAFYSGGTISTKIHKTTDYQSDFWNINGLRKIHEPSVSFNYIAHPTVKTNELNQFDDVDAVVNENFIRFKLENRLQTKRFKKQGAQSWNLLLHKVYFDYYPKGLAYASGKRDISNVIEEYEIRPFDWLKLDIDTRIDPYYKRYEEVSADLTFNKKEKGSLTLGHHYRREENCNTTATIKYNINEKWRTQVSTSYDFDEKRMNRQEYILFRDLHCWQTAFSYIREEDDIEIDNEFWITFYLTAFAEDAFDFSEGIKGSVK